MKNLNLSVLLIMFPTFAFSAGNGTNVNWSDYEDLSNFSCTGTLISGKYIITAAHCNYNENVLFQNNDVYSTTRTDHPYFDGSNGYDVSIWSLSDRYETEDVHYFSDLSQESVQIGDRMDAFGFGGTAETLSYATVEIEGLDGLFYSSKSIGLGATKPGDSGGPLLNQTGEIVGIHNSGVLQDIDDEVIHMKAVNLSKVSDFILDQVDGWHYPTLAKGDNVTVTVQSLHKNTTLDAAYVVGNLQITGGTCVGKSVIEPFDKCTYQLSAAGEGKLYLSSEEYIDINKSVSDNSGDSDSESGSSGGSGGSLGWFSLLVGWVLAERRRAKL